jgi:hypothetical protein
MHCRGLLRAMPTQQFATLAVVRLNVGANHLIITFRRLQPPVECPPSTNDTQIVLTSVARGDDLASVPGIVDINLEHFIPAIRTPFY